MSQCCDESECCEPVVTNIPGPEGDPGATGDPGADGVNAFSTVANYNPSPQPVMPPEGGPVNIIVGTTAWMGVDQPVYVEFWGTMIVTTIINSNTVTLTNPENAGGSEYLENAPPGTSLPALSKISPGGWQGPIGSAPGGALLSANNLNDVANAATSRTNLGLGTMAVQNAATVAITGGSIVGITDLAVADGGTGASDPTNARANLGLNIGINVMPYTLYGANLANLGPFTGADEMIYNTGLAAPALTPLTAFARTLLADANAAAMRTTLGVSATPLAMLLFRHEASAGSAGGNFSPASTWITVPINTEVVDQGNHGSIAANQITLAAGTYRYRYGVVTYGLDNQFQGRLYNVTGAAVISNSYGQVANSFTTGSDAIGVSNGSGVFTIGGATVIQLQAQSPSFKLTNGFGISAGLITDPGNEIYSWIELYKE